MTIENLLLLKQVTPVTVVLRRFGFDALTILLYISAFQIEPSHVEAFHIVCDPPRHANGRIQQPCMASSSVLFQKLWDNDEIEARSRQKAQQQNGIGETAAGAVLGGLLGGPFGAVFGATIGSNISARKALDRAKQQEMERMGLSQEMIDAANGVAVALEQSNEGLQAVQDSLATQQRLARLLDAEAVSLYQRAQKALTESDEEVARKLLLQRTELQEKLKKTLMNCAEDKKRIEKLEDNVAQLKRRALEVETLMRRSVSSKSIQNSSIQLSLPVEDPLLQKFKDLGID